MTEPERFSSATDTDHQLRFFMSDSHLLVDETDFHDALVSEALPPEPLEDGEARLRVDHWALTANNVSYALEGQRLGYWHYFPGLQGRGRVPAWGFADVVESAHADLPIGQRIYGFVPMSTRFTVKAESKRDGFVDASPHRASLPAFYNRYSLVEKRPIEGRDPSRGPPTPLRHRVSARSLRAQLGALRRRAARPHLGVEQDRLGDGPPAPST